MTIRHATLAPAEIGALLAHFGLQVSERSPLATVSGATPEVPVRPDVSDDEWGRALGVLARPGRQVRSVFAGVGDSVVSAYYGAAGSDQLVHCTLDAEGAHVSFPWSPASIAALAGTVLLAGGPPRPDASVALRLSPAGVTALAATVDLTRATIFSSLLRRAPFDELSFTADNAGDMIVEGFATPDPRWVVTLFDTLAPAIAPLVPDQLGAGLRELEEHGVIRRDGDRWQAGLLLLQLASWWRNPLPATAHEVTDLAADGQVHSYRHRITVRGDGPLVTIDYGADGKGGTEARLRAVRSTDLLDRVTNMLHATPLPTAAVAASAGEPVAPAAPASPPPPPPPPS